MQKVGLIQLDDCFERLGVAFLQGCQDLATPGVVAKGLAADLALVTLMPFEEAEPDYISVRAVRADETAGGLSLPGTSAQLLVIGCSGIEDLFDDEEQLLQVLATEALHIVGDVLNILGVHPVISLFDTGYQKGYRQGPRPTLGFRRTLEDYYGPSGELLCPGDSLPLLGLQTAIPGSPLPYFLGSITILL